MKSGIYIITNIITHKSYIGSAVNINYRWAKHKHMLKQNNHHSKHLQIANSKRGKPIPSLRKLNRWPHGCQCKCEDCVKLRKIYKSEYYNNSKSRNKQNVQNP